MPAIRKGYPDLVAVLCRGDPKWAAIRMVVIVVVKVQHKGRSTRLLARRGERFFPDRERRTFAVSPEGADHPLSPPEPDPSERSGLVNYLAN